MDDTLKADFLRHEAVDYIKHWIGTPYLWGGDDFSGFDCSGLAHEFLQSVGLEKINYDCPAHQIYLNFKEGRDTKGIAYAGCLVFWFNLIRRATHIAILINKDQIIEAAGGGSKTKTVQDAIKHNAYVRIRRLNYRGTNFKIIDPFKDWDPDENL